MKLIDDWRRIARKAWSVRFAILASLFSAGEVATQLLAPSYPGPWFAGLSALMCLGATLSRFIAQPRMRNGRE